MGIEHFGFRHAIRNLAGNRMGRWSARDVPGRPPFPHTVARRFEEGFVPKLDPKFRLAATDRLFTMGSCFARNIEQSLIDLGYDVLSHEVAFATEPADAGGGELSRDDMIFRMGFANKYNTLSMLNEFRWAAERRPAEDCPTIMTMGNGRVVDLNAHNILPGGERATVLARRKILTDITMRAFEADVVFLTLGLTETWFDKETGLYLNDHLSALGPADQDKERFEFRVLSFAENLAALQEIHAHLKAHGRAGCRLVVTVSPVPLLATFTRKDVVVANTYSKSVLHAVATEFCAASEGADYFPSYEMVVNAPPGQAWTSDHRHVQDAMVDRVMKTFVDAYAERRAEPDQPTARRA